MIFFKFQTSFLLTLSCIWCYCQQTSDSTSLFYGKTQSYKISDNVTYTYKKPKIWDAVNKLPKNFVNTAKSMVSKQNYPYGLAAIGSTLALIPADPWFINNSRSLGKSLGLSEDHKYIKLGFIEFIPANTSTALYFIGNGTAVILLSAGLGTYGIFKDDYRAQSTSLQLIESIAMSGLFVQPIKRLTGRESPFITYNEGRQHSYWKFAPSFAAYQGDTSRYDAMPSGHLTTGMAALTVLTENYPEKKWIKPLGYTMLGLMSFEMMQSKVHWIADYPIALFMGYLIGKNIAASRIIKTGSETSQIQKYHFSISSSTVEGIQTYGVNIQF